MMIEKYLNLISSYEREFKKWEGRSEKIVKRYRDDQRGDRHEAHFNILWSNVQTLVPACFSRLPQPDVSRRFRDQDPVGRIAAMIIERALDYEIQHYQDYRTTIEQCVYDRFMGGRGTAWIRYEPHIKASQIGEPEDGEEVTEDVEVEETVDYECAPIDYVHWKDFGHSVGRTWEEVTVVWRKVYMTQPALIERFGEEVGNKIPLDSKPEKEKNAETEDNRGLIYEIWDKEDKKARWMSKSLGEFVDEKEDPLGLEEFFPCPRPLYSTLTNETLVPVPDFTLYQDQARSLDVIADRIDGLVNALQVKGGYDASIPELGRLFTEGENGQLIPVKNWAAFAEKNGLSGSISLVDLKPIAEALKIAFESFQQQKDRIDEIVGIADIMRGESQNDVTATAERIKGQYASLRVRRMQLAVSQFATECLQLKAQVMLGKFSPETLIKISAVDQLNPVDQQLIPQAMGLLQQNPLRSFRIEVQADSLVQIDEEAEKQARVEFLTATGKFIEQATAAAAQSPVLVPLLMELLKFGVTGFKVGKSIEGVFDETADKLKQQAANPQPQPNPEMMKIQAQQQADQARQQGEQARLQHDQQVEAQRQQMEQETERAKAAREVQGEQAKAQREQMAEQQEHEREMVRIQTEAELAREKESMTQDTELRKAALQVAGQIEVAKINAGAKLQSDAMSQQPEEGVDAKDIMDQLLQTHEKLISALSAPKRIVRGADGLAQGIETIQ